MPAWITSPLVPVPRFPSLACLPRTSPLYSAVFLPAGIGAAASPHPGRERCGGGRAPRLPPRLRPQPRPRSREPRSEPRGGRTQGSPQLGTPLPESAAPRALGGRGAGPASSSRQSRSCGDPQQGGLEPGAGTRHRPRWGSPAGAPRGAGGPVTPIRSRGRDRRRRPSPSRASPAEPRRPAEALAAPREPPALAARGLSREAERDRQRARSCRACSLHYIREGGGGGEIH